MGLNTYKRKIIWLLIINYRYLPSNIAHNLNMNIMTTYMVSFSFKGENHCIPMTIPCSLNTEYSTVDRLIRDALRTQLNSNQFSNVSFNYKER